MGLFDIFKKKEIAPAPDSPVPAAAQLTEEQQKWNKLWDLWTNSAIESPYAELMTYQSEINNGGHSQYFANLENGRDFKAEITALNEILPSHLKISLKAAYKAYLLLEEQAVQEAETVLDRCDAIFYENEQEILQILAQRAAKIEL